MSGPASLGGDEAMSVYRKSFKDRRGVMRRTATYYAEIRDHLGRRQILSGFRDKSATRELERKLVRLAALRATDATPDEPTRRWIESLAGDLRDRLAEIGLITAQQVVALRPLSELVSEWADHLRAKGTSAAQVALVTMRAQRVLDGAGATYWTGIDPGRVERYLQAEREKVEGISARTSNFHLQAVRQFCRWAVRTGLAIEEPLRMLEPLNSDLDRRRERRALTTPELSQLLASTESGPVRDGLGGAERALIYAVATESGLRRNELCTIEVADVELGDSDRPAIRVRAGNAKNGRDARLPLRPETALALKRLVANRLPSARVFSVPKHWRAAETLRADLAAAGIADVDDAGRVIDFHSLRVTFATNLARAGVTLQVAQKLLRHSTPTLTANVYTVLGRDDEREAVGRLPQRDAVPAAVATQATGTEGARSAGSDLRADLQGRSQFMGPAGDAGGRAQEGPGALPGGDGGEEVARFQPGAAVLSVPSSTRGSSWVPGGPPGLQNRCILHKGMGRFDSDLLPPRARKRADARVSRRSADPRSRAP